MAEVLSLENGKYEVTFDAGKLSATRNGEPWRDLTGDKLIYAMMCECMNAQQQRTELLDALNAILNADSSYQWGGCSDQELAAIEKAEAAIAKAIGE